LGRDFHVRAGIDRNFSGGIDLDVLRAVQRDAAGVEFDLVAGLVLDQDRLAFVVDDDLVVGRRDQRDRLRVFLEDQFQLAARDDRLGIVFAGERVRRIAAAAVQAAEDDRVRGVIVDEAENYLIAYFGNEE